MVGAHVVGHDEDDAVPTDRNTLHATGAVGAQIKSASDRACRDKHERACPYVQQLAHRTLLPRAAGSVMLGRRMLLELDKAGIRFGGLRAVQDDFSFLPAGLVLNATQEKNLSLDSKSEIYFLEMTK